MSADLDVAAMENMLRQNGFLAQSVIGGFVSGSTVLGWANRLSDVDIHVFVTEPPDTHTERDVAHVALNPSVIVSDKLYADGVRWELEYWTTDQVDQLIEKVDQAAYDAGETRWFDLSIPEWAFLERTMHALSFPTGRFVKDLQERLVGSAFQKIAVATAIGRCDGSVDDAIGNLENGDTESSVLCAQLALGAAVDGLLAHYGLYGSQWPKWRARRMRQIDSPVLPFSVYWEALTMRQVSNLGERAWVEDCLGLCRTVTESLET